MKVIVDPTKCQGHVRCVQVAEEIFLQNEQGHSYTTGDDVPEQLHEAVRQAERNCPEGAITVFENA